MVNGQALKIRAVLKNLINILNKAKGICFISTLNSRTRTFKQCLYDFKHEKTGRLILNVGSAHRAPETLGTPALSAPQFSCPETHHPWALVVEQG